jgi:drug/metabolite transporter (DMT)-like permease
LIFSFDIQAERNNHVMKSLLLPLCIAAFGVVVYHIGQKSLPASINPMLLLMAVYAMAFVLAAIALPFFRTQSSLPMAQLFRWPVVLVAIGVLGIELGFLLVYRQGGSMQWSGIAVNGIAAVLLLPVALLVFKEHFSVVRALGVLLTLSGLTLMTHR